MTWQPGTRLNQYKIDRVLGSGGFGITYKATHLALNQRVVIKTINDTLHGDPEYQGYVERFRKEAQILAKLGELRHPHIVRVSDLFEAPLQEVGVLQRFWQDLWGIPVPKLPCLVMDFIEGENLFERVRQARSPLGEREALKYIQQAGDALALVHRAGLVHRDAHPGNIMICNGNAILIDFGLAGSVIPTVMSSKIGGNPAFAPPDQWRGNRKANVDIYTLAMSLYFALTADTPDPFTEPKAKNPAISDRTNTAIRKAIDLNPANRPQSIAEWFQALGGFALSPQALQPLPDLSEPVSKGKTGRSGRTERTRQVFGASNTSVSTERTRQVFGASNTSVSAQSSPSNVSRTVWIVAILALALLGWNWLRGVEPGTEIAGTSTESTAGQSPTTGQNPTSEGSGGSSPVGSGSETSSPATAGNPGNETPGNSGSTNPDTSTPPVQNPQTQTFLGVPVEPVSYTSARVSANGEVSPYAASGERYIETNLTLPAGAEPLAMVAIEGGTFTMGSPENEADRDSDEGPQHEVTVPSFLMGQYEVTQAQWKAVAQLPKIDRDLNPDPSYFKGDNNPVEQVSWDDAQEFIRRLNQRTGKTYRLPTEAEWEYAARAGTQTPFSYGETITPAVVNYDGNNPYGNAPEGEYRQKTIAVDSLYPNPWGLYHIHGNVWEWVEDGWHDNYRGAPTDGTAWLSSDERKVLRGGSWFDIARDSRSAVRDRWNLRISYLGFRVLLSSRTP